MCASEVALDLTARCLASTVRSFAPKTRYSAIPSALSEQDKLDALPVAGRLFMDVVRMIAYRAETRMMAPVIGAQGKKPNARRLLRALLTSDANIIPEPAQHILRIQLLGLGSDACDRMLAPLIEELNATRTIYPGTELRLVYEMAADSPLDVSSDSG